MVTLEHAAPPDAREAHGPSAVLLVLLLLVVALLARRSDPVDVALSLQPSTSGEVLLVRNDSRRTVTLQAARVTGLRTRLPDRGLPPGAVAPVRLEGCPTAPPTDVALVAGVDGREVEQVLSLSAFDRRLRERCDFYGPRSSVAGHVLSARAVGRRLDVVLELWNNSALPRTVRMRAVDPGSGFVPRRTGSVVLPPTTAPGEHLRGTPVRLRATITSTGCARTFELGQLPVVVGDERGRRVPAVLQPFGLAAAQQEALDRVCP